MTNSSNSSNPSLIVKYWGVRGSIPTPMSSEQVMEKQVRLLYDVVKGMGKKGYPIILEKSPKKIEKAVRKYIEKQPLSIGGTYGGNTTCIEVQARDSPLIIIDAGTGIRNLGNVLMGRLFSGKHLNPLGNFSQTEKDLHIFFTHYHWDHIQGFPFFVPAFLSNENALNITFYGKRDTKNKDTRQNLTEVLANQQQDPNFPVRFEDMACKKDYKELGRLNPSPILPTRGSSVVVEYRELDHPGTGFGYSFYVDGKKFTCATDTEHRDSVDPALMALTKDADILYYDGQYTPEEYGLKGELSKFRWGHSTYEWGVKTALAANVKTLVLGHHDQMRDDFQIQEIHKRAKIFKNQQLKLPENKGKKLEIIMAYEGLEHRL